MGAEGIGLCRTEHMFFDTEARRLAIQEMIVAETLETRKKALAKLLPFQTDDFYGIFKAMNGLPVTIRLIDPPLHEFTPKDDAGVEKLSKVTGLSPDKIRHRCEQLHEANPMLGHRGCRLCITYPEILDMQVTAIIGAAIKCRRGRLVGAECAHRAVGNLLRLRVGDGERLCRRLVPVQRAPGTFEADPCAAGGNQHQQHRCRHDQHQRDDQHRGSGDHFRRG